MMYHQTVSMTGYNYPTPSIPFIEGSTSSTPTYEYDNYNDYDPNDVPPDQAAPITGSLHGKTLRYKTYHTLGYSYLVPANPITLPPPNTTPRPTESLPGYQNKQESISYSYPTPNNPLGKMI